MSKEDIRKRALLVLAVILYIINIILIYKKDIIKITDLLTILVLLGIFIVGFQIVQYRKDIWFMIGICIMDYIFVDTQAVGNIKIDGNEVTVTLNILFIFLVFNLIYLFSRNLMISTILIQTFTLIVGVINYFLMKFRGRGLYFSDLRSINTVLNVADKYHLDIDLDVIYSIICLIVIPAIVYIIAFKDSYSIRHKIKWKDVFATLFVGIILYNVNVLGSLGHQVYWWAHSAINGFYVGFILQAENYGTKASDNYSKNEILKLEKKYKEKNQKEVRNPDIIVIMNESYADLSVIDTVHTNMDYMPYFRSLTENCVKGNLYVSVRGGNTANTEYEYLTGDTMGFFDYGQVVYNSYINRNIESNVSHIKKNNYQAYAFHPWLKSGWNRETVYDYLGFDNKVFFEDIIEDGVDAIRGYPSDEYTYRKLNDLYSGMPDDQQRFIFCVTMQNHAGYDNEDWIPFQQITLQGKDKYPLTTQYLSLIYESDKALEQLINTYKESDRDVVICFFGDHQPGIENSFYKKLYGKSLSSLSLEETQKEYITPFLIWTNYDIESQYVDKISANYLFAYMCKVAGINMSPFNNYLMDLYNKYPVINSEGAIDKDNNYYSADELQEIDEIQQYFDIIYNQIIDKNNVVESFYK